MKKYITKNSTTSKKTIAIICITIILITTCLLVVYYYFNKQTAQSDSNSGLTAQSEITANASSALTALKSYYAQNGTYPTANNCTNPTASEICLVSDKDNITYSYSASANDNYKTYWLEIIDKDSNMNYVLSTSSELHNTNK